MGKRIVTSIRIDENVLKKAKEIGLNVSKVSENALKNMISRLEASNPQTSNIEGLNEGGTGTVGSVVRGTGLEPAQAYANRSTDTKP